MTSETKTKETNALYDDLREHYLADGVGILPQRKEVMQIMKLRFAPEEAGLALSIPMQALGRISLEDLAEKAGKGETEVWSTLESLLSKGIVYMQRSRRTGEEKYCLWDWWYSLLTPMWGDGLVDDTKLKVATLREKLWDGGYPFLLNPSTHPGGGRIMPYEPTLDPASPVPDYERYSHYVENAEAICVVACGCRMSVGKCREPV